MARQSAAPPPGRIAHPATVRALQQRLMAWYRQHGRDLPWRRTRDPYAILVSEMMLQQTQVQRALLYYEKFLSRYPTVEDLARADTPEVREMWHGLGYYARARNLQLTSQKIVADHGGCFPDTPEGLQKLPGIGPYTAGAVSSFAFRRPTAILDTNAAPGAEPLLCAAQGATDAPLSVVRGPSRHPGQPGRMSSIRRLWMSARLFARRGSRAARRVRCARCVGRSGKKKSGEKRRLSLSGGGQGSGPHLTITVRWSMVGSRKHGSPAL